MVLPTVYCKYLLYLIIFNDKQKWRLSSSHKGSGLGLDAVRRRLAVRYPNRHRFTLTEDEGFVVATLDLEGKPCSV